MRIAGRQPVDLWTAGAHRVEGPSGRPPPTTPQAQQQQQTRLLMNFTHSNFKRGKFHKGEADPKTHPGHRGIDTEYDQLKSWLDDEIACLKALPTLYRAKFRELPGQEGLPRGMQRDLEVAWSPSSA